MPDGAPRGRVARKRVDGPKPANDRERKKAKNNSDGTNASKLMTGEALVVGTGEEAPGSRQHRTAWVMETGVAAQPGMRGRELITARQQ